MKVFLLSDLLHHVLDEPVGLLEVLWILAP